MASLLERFDALEQVRKLPHSRSDHANRARPSACRIEHRPRRTATLRQIARPLRSVRRGSSRSRRCTCSRHAIDRCAGPARRARERWRALPASSRAAGSVKQRSSTVPLLHLGAQRASMIEQRRRLTPNRICHADTSRPRTRINALDGSSRICATVCDPHPDVAAACYSLRGCSNVPVPIDSRAPPPGRHASVALLINVHVGR